MELLIIISSILRHYSFVLEEPEKPVRVGFYLPTLAGFLTEVYLPCLVRD